jgi:hypothetical protein
MRLELVRDVPYTGYCDYASNTMRLNADQPFTAERLKLLVLHEAYPGHDYHLSRREHEVRSGQQPLNSLLVITNTPSSPLFEGIGDNGALFLHWLSPAERLDFDLGMLRSAACVNASYYLGYRTVAEASAAWHGGRSDFYTCLYRRMHSPRSLQLAAELSARST